jgi:predicted transcriptional regulator
MATYMIPLSHAEQSILYTLRHTSSARYSDLQKPTGLESDVFKFHLRKLVRNGYVLKEDSVYILTATGKEFANNLHGNHVQKQPKLSLFLIVSRTNQNGIIEYLLQERHRNPFYGYIGCLSGPAKWGEEFETTAKEELMKQAGITATFKVASFKRVRDHDPRQVLLEDKLFVILQAHIDTNVPLQEWSGGTNMWLSLEKILQMTFVFPQTVDLLRALSDAGYTSESLVYDTSHY